MLPARENLLTTLHFDFLHEIFETQADARPSATAVLFDGQKTSYAQLEERSNRLAHYLRHKGLKSGSFVGILLHKSVDAYVALLAVLKADQEVLRDRFTDRDGGFLDFRHGSGGLGRVAESSQRGVNCLDQSR